MSHRKELRICSIKSDTWKLSDAMLGRMEKRLSTVKKITGGKNPQQHCSAFKYTMRSKPSGKSKATTCGKRNVSKPGTAKLKQRSATLSQMRRRQRKKNVERGKTTQPCSQQPGKTHEDSRPCTLRVLV